MAKELPSLGELEIEVLRTVWREQPCTERQVSDQIIAERQVARTTVLKTIQRLEGKGLLVRVPGAGAVRFRAALDEQRVMPALIQRFVRRVLGGSAAPLIAYLGDSTKLSAKDLETLRKIAKKVSETANDD
jgi:BlaI family transcriptional regulator, penicillinase repressor